jgi:hypothetical protein
LLVAVGERAKGKGARVKGKGTRSPERFILKCAVFTKIEV